MRVGGQRSNPQPGIEILINLLMDPAGRQQRAELGKAKVTAVTLSAPRPRKLRARQGVIQRTVFAVLEEARGPLSVTEIHARVEGGLGRGISRDTVNSCLSVAARDPTRPIARCELGLYVATSGAVQAGAPCASSSWIARVVSGAVAGRRVKTAVWPSRVCHGPRWSASASSVSCGGYASAPRGTSWPER